MADRLVTEADAKHRLPAGERPDDFEGHPGFARRAGTRREQDAVGVEREGPGGRDFVVPEHALLHAQLAEILDQVEGKRVEVVDDEQHGSRRSVGSTVEC